MAPAPTPDRWMHLRRPTPFDEQHFRIFQASAGLLAAYAGAFLHNATVFIGPDHPSLEYVFFPCELSGDRTVMTLPIGGPRSLGSRAYIENGASYLLWQRLPHQILATIEEGITESLSKDGPAASSWRPLSHFLFRRPETIEVLPSSVEGIGAVRLGGRDPESRSRR